MKKLLFILLLYVSFVGCGQNEIQKEYYEDGTLKGEISYKDGEKNGMTKWYHQNGQLSSEVNLTDGIPNGILKQFHENGQLGLEGKLIDNKKEGLWRWYYKNGKLKEETNYSQGVKNGSSIKYDVDGSGGKGNFKNGKQDGLWKYCLVIDEKGEHWMEINYKDGEQIGSTRTYTINNKGQMIDEFEY
jgi:antitoxin component YwqK of YwqJK toxin-antitoxin module